MKRLTQRFMLLIVATIGSVVIAECALRLAGIGFPMISVPDEQAGWKLQPGFRQWFSQEGGAYVQINSRGFRDVEHSLDKPADTFRIAVLGDSYAEAVQVPLEQTFWARLPDLLANCRRWQGRRVEVLNFGVSGYGTAQELEVLRKEVWQFHPDLILLAFFAGNDLRNNCRSLEPQQARPFYRLEGSELVRDESFLDHPDFVKAQQPLTRWKVRLINHSRLLQLLVEVKGRWRQTGPPSAGGGNKELGVDDLCFVAPSSPEWIEAWSITEKLLAAMSFEVRQQGAELFVATVTAGIQVHPDGKVREAYLSRLGATDLFYAERRLQGLAARAGFHLIALGPRMLELAQKEQLYLHGFPNTQPGEGHWNAAGHRAAAELISRDICELRE